MFRFGLILAFLFSALPAGAKDFYIAANQAGAGTGTGCSSAKSYTWFNNTASWGTGAAQIGPGTTVHLCGTFVGTPGQQPLHVRAAVSELRVRERGVKCVYWVNLKGLTITHVTCHDAGWAFAGYGNNFTLSYSNIYNIDHGLAFGPQGTTSGFSIHDNHIHDYVKWDSTTNAYHHDGLHIWGQNGGVATNGVIYNNLFDGDSGVNITGHIYIQDSVKNVSVYNNVFLVPSNRTINALWFSGITSAGVLPGGPATGNSAYNNFIRAGGHTHGTGIYATAQNNFTAANNALLGGNSDRTIQGGGALSAAVINNNIYEDLLKDVGSLNTFRYQGHNYHDLASRPAACHCDSKSKLAPASQINASSLGQLLSGSVAISAAANLINMTSATWSPLANAIVGAPGPLGGTWDAGAYKFGSTGLPSLPTGLL